VNRQCVDAAGKLIRECGVDHAVTLQPALSAKRLRHDIESKMGLPAGTVSRVAFVAMRLVFHPETLWRESLAQLFRDEIACRHSFVNPGIVQKGGSWFPEKIMLLLKTNGQCWERALLLSVKS